MMLIWSLVMVIINTSVFIGVRIFCHPLTLSPHVHILLENLRLWYVLSTHGSMCKGMLISKVLVYVLFWNSPQLIKCFFSSTISYLSLRFLAVEMKIKF